MQEPDTAFEIFSTTDLPGEPLPANPVPAMLAIIGLCFVGIVSVTLAALGAADMINELFSPALAQLGRTLGLRS
jgi:hypothetical protein